MKPTTILNLKTQEESKSMWEQLNCLANEERLNRDHVDRARPLLTQHVSNVIFESANYSPDWALSIYMTFKTTPPITIEERRRRAEEAIRHGRRLYGLLLQASRRALEEPESLDEITTYVQFRPASKVFVESLSRKVYKKTTSTSSSDICTICLDEFKTRERVVKLPCGHEFDDSCILEWFSANHVCPLCRYELPRENQVKRALEFGLGI
ncbi:unnamed protein product [Microthlaspi erraticum]|uniref:RING-type domain-containing protein n=1 Tax=Microthlaspi erraticum TaxID=1685480 RepID=A0A6D2IQB3_9BRAS|nr:unnamed protein product [Microthlaspi erraticum]